MPNGHDGEGIVQLTENISDESNEQTDDAPTLLSVHYPVTSRATGHDQAHITKVVRQTAIAHSPPSRAPPRVLS